MFEVNNKDTATTSGVVLQFLLLTFTIFHTFFSVSIVDYEQLNVCWVGPSFNIVKCFIIKI